MKKIKILIFVLTTIFLIVFVNKNLNFKKNILNENKRIISDLTIKNRYIKNINLVDSLELKNSLKKTPNIQIYNEKNKGISFEYLLEDELTLIYRYFDITCQPCVVSTLKHIKKSLKNDSNLKIIANYESRRELLQFKRINKINLEVFNLKNKKLIPELDTQEIPYLLLVDKNYNIKSVHILFKDFKKRNNTFIKSVCNFLNQ